MLEFNEAFLIEGEIEIVIHVNGKARDRMMILQEASKEAIEKPALDREKAAEHTEGKTIREVMVVPGRLVNVVSQLTTAVNPEEKRTAPVPGLEGPGNGAAGNRFSIS